MKKLVLLVLSLALTACAHRGWMRENTTEMQFNKDKYLCQQQAASTFPTAMVETAGSNAPPPQGQMIGPHYVAPSMTQYLAASMPKSYDANSSNRDEMFRSCMTSQGYRYGSKNK